MTQPRLPLPYVGPEIYATLVAERDFDPADLVVATPTATLVMTSSREEEAEVLDSNTCEATAHREPQSETLDATTNEPAQEVAAEAPALPAAFVGLGSHFAALPSIPPMMEPASTGSITGEPPAAAAC